MAINKDAQEEYIYTSARLSTTLATAQLTVRTLHSLYSRPIANHAVYTDAMCSAQAAAT